MTKEKYDLNPFICNNCNSIIPYAKWRVKKSYLKKYPIQYCSSQCRAIIASKNSQVKNKICKICKENKDINNFYFANKQKTVYAVMCKECLKKESAIRNKNNPNRKFVVIKNQYGISKENWESMFEKFNGLCWICRKNQATSVDHCHKTNVVRGLLCNSCNWGLGHFTDDSNILVNAIKYLQGAL